jgi:hypothetical protein
VFAAISFASSLGWSEDAVAGDDEGSAAVPAPFDASVVVVVLFAVQYASDGERAGWFAVPVACVDSSGAFVTTPESCVVGFPVGAALQSTDFGDQIVPAGAMVDVPDRYAQGLPLSGEPPGNLYYWNATDVAPPRPDCLPRRAGLDVGSMQPAELATAGVDAANAGSAVEGLGQPWVANSFVEGDLDGDGQRDRLLGTSFESDDGAERCDVVVSVWGDGEVGPRAVEVACEEPTEWSLSGRYGPFNLSSSTCWDLNRDGRVELWLSTGFESMRGYEFVEMRDGHLERVGGTMWFGD